MTVTTPPRSPHLGDPVGPDLDDTDGLEAGVPEALIEEARRHARRRRRITGAVVVAAVAAVVALVAFDGGPPSQGASAAFDTVSGVPVADGSDRATLVAGWGELHEGWTMVYEDGLVLWWSDRNWTIRQRRLTPEGVDLVRSGAIDMTGLPPTSRALPAYSALRGESMPEDMWADAEEGVWLPSEYAVCAHDLEGETPYPGLATPIPSLGQFPDQVQALLAGKQRTYHIGEHPAGVLEEPLVVECFALTSEDAYTLVELDTILPTDNYEFFFTRIGLPDIDFTLADGATVSLGVWPVLPHGEFFPFLGYAG
jgi:hypothetical protein